VFGRLGLTSVRTGAGSREHRRYLRKMGFRPDDGGWIRNVDSDPVG
jgi:hypothetical protein